MTILGRAGIGNWGPEFRGEEESGEGGRGLGKTEDHATREKAKVLTGTDMKSDQIPEVDLFATPIPLIVP